MPSLNPFLDTEPQGLRVDQAGDLCFMCKKQHAGAIAFRVFRMRILTFNSFPGSPLPFVRNGTLGIGQTSRLKHQIQELELFDYEIGCFQEIFSSKALRFYNEYHYRKGYGTVRTQSTWQWSRCFIAVGLRLLISFVILLALFGFVTWFFCDCCAIDTAVVLLGLMITYVSVDICCHEWTLLAFTSAVNHAGLLTVYRKATLDLIDSTTVYLPQKGDFMNWIQPRLCLLSRFRCKRSGRVFGVANVHLNALGRARHRVNQLDVVYQHLKCYKSDFNIVAGDFNADPDSMEIKAFRSYGWLDSADAVSHISPEPTWSSNNTLANGWLRVPSTRVDFIFFETVSRASLLYRVLSYQTVMKGLCSTAHQSAEKHTSVKNIATHLHMCASVFRAIRTMSTRWSSTPSRSFRTTLEKASEDFVQVKNATPTSDHYGVLVEFALMTNSISHCKP